MILRTVDILSTVTTWLVRLQVLRLAFRAPQVLKAQALALEALVLARRLPEALLHLQEAHLLPLEAHRLLLLGCLLRLQVLSLLHLLVLR